MGFATRGEVWDGLDMKKPKRKPKMTEAERVKALGEKVWEYVEHLPASKRQPERIEVKPRDTEVG